MSTQNVVKSSASRARKAAGGAIKVPSQMIEQILKARVYDVAQESPLEPAPRLSQRLGCPVLLKREDLQQVFSFKLRGAYNKIVNLSAEELARGVIAASAGNHAQGVALAAQRLGIKAVIVMPRTTPAIKIEAVRARGVRAVLHGDAYDDALTHALGLAEEKGYTFIHPYDDPLVIAGQGTVAMEMTRQHNAPLHAVFVPVGGGGLIAGMAAWFKFLHPEVKVIGVEPDDAPTLHAAMAADRRVKLDQVGLFVDGVAVRQIGKETFKLARDLVDEVVLVSVDEICAAVKDVFDDTRAIAEPAGALAIAGMKRYAEREGLTGAPLAAVLSGANVNFDRLRHIAERAELGEGREAVLAVTIPEKPGSFRNFIKTLGRRSITEFNYRFASDRAAHIFVGVQLDGGERADLIAELIAKGYGVQDLSDNETAKLHVRYMVGGHAMGLENEIIYRFEFPERPGALLQFLTNMQHDWNISLFHYRNHGAAYGRVLCGVQVPPKERKAFRQFLDQLGYQYADETENPAYQTFLSC